MNRFIDELNKTSSWWTPGAKTTARIVDAAKSSHADEIAKITSDAARQAQKASKWGQKASSAGTKHIKKWEGHVQERQALEKRLGELDNDKLRYGDEFKNVKSRLSRLDKNEQRLSGKYRKTLEKRNRFQERHDSNMVDIESRKGQQINVAQKNYDDAVVGAKAQGDKETFNRRMAIGGAGLATLGAGAYGSNKMKQQQY